MAFASTRVARGYATARPPVHALMLARAGEVLGLTVPTDRALDVGCGAGRSTDALTMLARARIGLDPSPTMIAGARGTPGTSFAQGRAEQLPIRTGSCDLVTAAGSLPFATLGPSLDEAARVLAPTGALVVHDFGPPTDPSDPLADWWRAFLARWPAPPPPTAVTPAALGAGPLVLVAHEPMVVEATLDLEEYVAYVMTETNVEHAHQAGTALETIRVWCAETLAPLLARPGPVRFDASLSCLVPAANDLRLIGGREPRPIEIAPPDPAWPARFALERERIRAALGARARRIAHIGSTSVPGLGAKPIIDILVAVDDVTDPLVTTALVTAGFPLRVLEPGHRMCRTPGRDVHVHLWPRGSDDVRRHLLFRDWLRHDADDRARYEAVKRDLARRDWADMNDYADAKSEVVGEITVRAEAWARATSWSVGPGSSG